MSAVKDRSVTEAGRRNTRAAHPRSRDNAPNAPAVPRIAPPRDRR